MSDIYGLLSKHFDGNISDEEYREIELYRLNNPEESCSCGSFATDYFHRRCKNV